MNSSSLGYQNPLDSIFMKIFALPSFLRCFLKTKYLLGLLLILAFFSNTLPGSAQSQPSSPKKPLPSFFIGHRYYVKKGVGWGWIKQPHENWSQARWSAIREQPDKGWVKPHRQMKKASADHDNEYRLYGHWAPDPVYDPKWNEILPVFVITNYESLGLVAPLNRKPGSELRERDTNPSTKKRRMLIRPNHRGDWMD